MTLEELKSEVLALGFETELDGEGALLHAANRALLSIFTEREVTADHRFYRRKSLPSQYYPHIHHKGGEELSFSVFGRAVSFLFSGRGSVRISGKAGFDIELFGTVTKKVFIDGTATVTLHGAYDFDIYSFAVFDSKTSPDAEDIEFIGKFASYDIKRECPDFLAFHSAPTDGYGREISGARVLGSVLEVPRDFEGEIRLTYKRMPKLLRSDTVDGEIDLPAECTHLFPLLVASYLWLDDNPELSASYLALYREGMAAVRLFNKRRIASEYEDVLGWA